MWKNCSTPSTRSPRPLKKCPENVERDALIIIVNCIVNCIFSALFFLFFYHALNKTLPLCLRMKCADSVKAACFNVNYVPAPQLCITPAFTLCVHRKHSL